MPRQVITVRTGKGKVDRDEYRTPILDPRRRQKLSFGGSTSIMTLVTVLRVRLLTQRTFTAWADITAWETS